MTFQLPFYNYYDLLFSGKLLLCLRPKKKSLFGWTIFCSWEYSFCITSRLTTICLTLWYVPINTIVSTIKINMFRASSKNINFHDSTVRCLEIINKDSCLGLWETINLGNDFGYHLKDFKLHFEFLPNYMKILVFCIIFHLK